MKKYTKLESIHPCRLERNDLLELIKIVKETFPVSGRKEDFEIYTTLPNISISSNSIEDFLKHEELPDELNKLSFNIIGWSKNREIDKSVRMTFYNNYIDLDIDGREQTWVLGKYSQITDFLRKKRPWFWALHKLSPYIRGIIAGIIPVLSLIVTVELIKAKAIIYSISTALLLIAWVFAIVFYFKGTLLPYTKIIITPKKSFFNKENITIIVLVLTFIVSIIGGIIIPLIK